MNSNFEEYFVKKLNQNFNKNFQVWKSECEDFVHFNGEETKEDLFRFYHPEETGICKHEGCDAKTKLVSIFKGYKDFCCWKHANESGNLRKYGVTNVMCSPEVKEKLRLSVQKKYGVDCIWQAESVKEKIKTTMKENHGVENPMYSAKIKEKLKHTILANYGVENVSQSNEIKQKKIETCLMNYGVGSPMHSDEIKEKMKQLSLEKYGVEYPIQSQQVKNNAIRNNLEKYGVEYPMQLQEFSERVSKTHKEKYADNHWMKDPIVLEKRRQTYLKHFGVNHPMQLPSIYERKIKSGYKVKDYFWKTGEISKIQGHEPIVLKELENKGYSFNEVKTSQKDMPEIWYEFEGIKRRYFPDFYIPKENLIIEVKSDWTLMKDWHKNIAKCCAVIEMGFNFKLEVR